MKNQQVIQQHDMAIMDSFIFFNERKSSTRLEKEPYEDLRPVAASEEGQEKPVSK